MRDKKKTIIIISIFLIIIALVIFLIIKKNTIKLFLNGDNEIIVRYGTKFIDPGAKATDGFGNDVSEYIKSYGEVNSHILGTYKIVYELDYHGMKTIERTVIVQNIPIEDLEIKLNGEEEVYILKDNSYIEEGAYIYSKIDDVIIDNEKLSITSNVDTSKTGDYSVDYVLNYDGSMIFSTRKVIVFDIDYSLTPEGLTSDKVVINLELNNINDAIIKLPDGKIESNNIKYEVNSNGDYPFVVTLSNNKTYTKVITIDNIIGDYKCSGEITSIGTKLTVNNTKDIKKYNWKINNEIINGSNIYSKNIPINKASIELVFNDDRTYEVNCSITDKLVYHFKYDEFNTKPYMKCDTYTASDKVRLDAMLKQVVDEAGYGTRAGVVAAARFLVGGLDYKVFYQGPKKVNGAIGRYNRVGLNIGQSGAWGCYVNGYRQGMDCTNFVSWAFYQNGIKTHPYNTNHKPVREVINQVKVGDLLYTPCTRGNECKNTMRIDHVGIIIGIDDNYIYVAESTTGDINAIVVTKLDKHNLPSSGKFSAVHFFNYATEGNVTNMWMG